MISTQKAPRVGGAAWPEATRGSRSLAGWFILVPLVVVTLLCTGEVALSGARDVAFADTRSRLQADYGPWEVAKIRVLRPDILGEIGHDQVLLVGQYLPPITVPADFWETTPPGATSVASTRSTPSGTATPTLITVGPPSSETLVPNFSTPTPTGPTATRSPASSPNPTATRSPTPPWTSTPQPSPSRTSAPTATPPPTLVPSPTFTVPATSAATASPTAAPPPTATGFPVGGTYWLCNDADPLAYMMRPSSPGGSEQSVSGMVVNRFHSPSFQSGASLAAGTTTLHLYVTNTLPMSAMIGMGLYAGEDTYTLLGSKIATIPGETATPSTQSFSFNTDGYNFMDGQRLKLEVYGNFGVTIYWDGQYGDSRLDLP